MKTITLPCTPDEFLKRLQFATETDTVEKNQTSAKEAIFYSHATENCFTLYERPAFVKDKTFYLGGMLMRGAVVPSGTDACQVATEYGRFGENTRTSVICLILLILSVALTIGSGNLFATMFPILALLSGGYLIADLLQALLQIRRLKKKWAVILSATLPDIGKDA